MSKPSHTPGPWAWRSFGGSYCLVADHGARKIILDAKEGGKFQVPLIHTRDFADGSILQPITPDHPNARLVAAAAEMYEALKAAAEFSMVQHNSLECGKRGKSCICGYDAVHAAIAKAEGRDE